MPTLPQRRTIVITGCSSGFGRVTALHLARLGWQVFATVRKEADQASLLSEALTLGCKEYLTPLVCDIIQPEQVESLGQAVAAATPQLDALLNNAGATFAAPLEILSLKDLRAQLEINVVAHVGVTQALLPLLKAARGTIMNVSSLNGRFAVPVLGAYSASKFALEAISDAWRVELAPFDVRVVVIEPGSSPTHIWKTSRQRVAGSLEEHRNGPYGHLLTTMEKIANRAEAGVGGFPPQLFADTVVRILAHHTPHTRYVLPRKMTWMILLRKLLPDRLWDLLLRRTLKW